MLHRNHLYKGLVYIKPQMRWPTGLLDSSIHSIYTFGINSSLTFDKISFYWILATLTICGSHSFIYPFSYGLWKPYKPQMIWPSRDIQFYKSSTFGLKPKCWLISKLIIVIYMTFDSMVNPFGPHNSIHPHIKLY